MWAGTERNKSTLWYPPPLTVCTAYHPTCTVRPPSTVPPPSRRRGSIPRCQGSCLLRASYRPHPSYCPTPYFPRSPLPSAAPPHDGEGAVCSGLRLLLVGAGRAPAAAAGQKVGVTRELPGWGAGQSHQQQLVRRWGSHDCYWGRRIVLPSPLVPVTLVYMHAYGGSQGGGACSQGRREEQKIERDRGTAVSSSVNPKP